MPPTVWKVALILLRVVQFAETGVYGFTITNGEKSRSANVANFWNLRNYKISEPWVEFPPVANRVKSNSNVRV